MITEEEWVQVCSLLKQGLSISQISDKVNRSSPSLANLIKNGGPKTNIYPVKNVPEKIVKFADYLHSRLKSGVTNYTKLFLEIKALGYNGSYNSLYSYLRSNFPADDYRPSRRFETGPGEQAQVDWGTLGTMEIDGASRQVYCFVYVLGFSRAMYSEITVKQDLQTFQRCHLNAFKKLGIPQSILYDNIKTVVIKREKQPDLSEKTYYNLAFLDFAKYYSFKIELCPPYWPRSKGKVEAGVKYIKNSFLHDIDFSQNYASLNTLNISLDKWLAEIANSRLHVTTHEKPFSRWEKEKSFLHFVDQQPDYKVSPFLSRNSTQDAMVQYRTNFYSIPAEYSRRKLSVREVNTNGIQILEIYFEDKLIATHKLSLERGLWIMRDEHLTNNQPSLKPKNIRMAYPEVTPRSLSYYDRLVKINHG